MNTIVLLTIKAGTTAYYGYTAKKLPNGALVLRSETEELFYPHGEWKEFQIFRHTQTIKSNKHTASVG